MGSEEQRAYLLAARGWPLAAPYLNTPRSINWGFTAWRSLV